VTDIYRPDQWHDYFITVGGASAALTGLVFVAMSLNPGVIAQDQTHRRRAVGTLAGFTAIFVICALGVMGGQDHRAIGLEWLTVSAVATVVYVYGYIQAIRFGGSSVGLRPYRLVGGTALHIMEIVGCPAAQQLRRRLVSGGDFDDLRACLHDLRRLVTDHGCI
jgi:hypothetical protein